MQSETSTIFAANVARARKNRGLSVAELARLLDLTEAAIYKWERDGAVPKGKVIDKLNEIFGLKPGQLFAEGMKVPETTNLPKLTIKDHVDAVNNYPGKIIFKLAEKADAGGWTTKVRILLIEDDEIVLEILQKEFEKEGFEVFTKTNGKEALDFLEHHDVEVVISDNHMPNVTGRVVMQYLFDKRPEIIRVVASGTINEPELEKLKPHAFLRKPYQRKDLVNAVKKLLSERNRYDKNG
jgi:CheY-like chemotaxis protein/DNA-binding XRE family transcriptional regulator